jgi:hypothetical protein
MGLTADQANLVLTVPKTLRDQSKQQKEFWKQLGQLFVELAGHLTAAELEILRHKYPLGYQLAEALP